MDATVMARWALLCSAAVACFSLSGAAIMQMPSGDRRTLFIFPAFLLVALGGSLAVFRIDRFGIQAMAGPILLPVVLVLLARGTMPGWAMTVPSYVALIAAVMCADQLLEGSSFR
jgi:hypothetical protein